MFLQLGLAVIERYADVKRTCRLGPGGSIEPEWDRIQVLACGDRWMVPFDLLAESLPVYATVTDGDDLVYHRDDRSNTCTDGQLASSGLNTEFKFPSLSSVIRSGFLTRHPVCQRDMAVPLRRVFAAKFGGESVPFADLVCRDLSCQSWGSDVASYALERRVSLMNLSLRSWRSSWDDLNRASGAASLPVTRKRQRFKFLDARSVVPLAIPGALATEACEAWLDQRNALTPLTGHRRSALATSRAACASAASSSVTTSTSDSDSDAAPGLQDPTGTATDSLLVAKRIRRGRRGRKRASETLSRQGLPVVHTIGVQGDPASAGRPGFTVTATMTRTSSSDGAPLPPESVRPTAYWTVLEGAGIRLPPTASESPSQAGSGTDSTVSLIGCLQRAMSLFPQSFRKLQLPLHSIVRSDRPCWLRKCGATLHGNLACSGRAKCTFERSVSGITLVWPDAREHAGSDSDRPVTSLYDLVSCPPASEGSYAKEMCRRCSTKFSSTASKSRLVMPDTLVGTGVSAVGLLWACCGSAVGLLCVLWVCCACSSCVRCACVSADGNTAGRRTFTAIAPLLTMTLPALRVDCAFSLALPLSLDWLAHPLVRLIDRSLVDTAHTRMKDRSKLRHTLSGVVISFGDCVVSCSVVQPCGSVSVRTMEQLDIQVTASSPGSTRQVVLSKALGGSQSDGVGVGNGAVAIGTLLEAVGAVPEATAAVTLEVLYASDHYRATLVRTFVRCAAVLAEAEQSRAVYPLAFKLVTVALWYLRQATNAHDDALTETPSDGGGPVGPSRSSAPMTPVPPSLPVPTRTALEQELLRCGQLAVTPRSFTRRNQVEPPLPPPAHVVCLPAQTAEGSGSATCGGAQSAKWHWHRTWCCEEQRHGDDKTGG